MSSWSRLVLPAVLLSLGPSCTQPTPTPQGANARYEKPYDPQDRVVPVQNLAELVGCYRSILWANNLAG